MRLRRLTRGVASNIRELNGHFLELAWASQKKALPAFFVLLVRRRVLLNSDVQP